MQQAILSERVYQMVDGEAPTGDAGFDLSSVLGTSSEGDPTGGTGDQSYGQPTGSESAESEAYKFAGREYKSQQEAEKAYNQIYGKYSEQQGLMNKVKALLNQDPEIAASLAQDPANAEILAKLGIQQASEDLRRQEQQDPSSQFDWSKVPEPMQQMYQQVQIESARNELDREAARFERTLKREVTDQEHDAVLEVISRAPSLTYAEAWKLAHHDKTMQALQKRAASVGQQPRVDRPKPVPALDMPGVKIDTKKPVEQMSKTEFREFLRSNPEFNKMIGS